VDDIGAISDGVIYARGMGAWLDHDETDVEMVDCCPVCRHALDEQERPDLQETLRRFTDRLLRRPTLAAQCGSTIGVTAARHAQCRCRHPFHGS
jgi:hypothetical protein